MNVNRAAHVSTYSTSTTLFRRCAMVDLGSNVVLVVCSSNLWTELVPCRGGVDSHFHTRGHNPGPPGTSRPLATAIDVFAVVGEMCGSMGCRINGDAGYGGPLPLSATAHGAGQLRTVVTARERQRRVNSSSTNPYMCVCRVRWSARFPACPATSQSVPPPVRRRSRTP
jgi:hypothetical protein